jgi:hypothetical protein
MMVPVESCFMRRSSHPTSIQAADIDEMLATLGAPSQPKALGVWARICRWLRGW